MPSLYNAYKAKLINVLYSKLYKEKKKDNDLIILGDLTLLKKSGLFLGATSPHTHVNPSLFSWATCPHPLTVVYFQGRLAHIYSKWFIFTGDLTTHAHSGLFSRVTSPHTYAGLFSRATCPHPLTVVYFQGRPAHTYSKWSIFTGNLPTHVHSGLFSRATSPHTHAGLFSRATCLHILKVVYF